MIVREVYKVDMLSQWDYSGQLTDALLDQLKLCCQTYCVGDKDFIWVPIFLVWSIADLTSRKSYYECGIVFDVREAMIKKSSQFEYSFLFDLRCPLDNPPVLAQKRLTLF